jgi:RNA polymerase sigma-70 factor (ECF subfamily)
MSSPARSLETQLGDAEIVARIVAGDTDLFGVLVRRYNQRLFRAVRSLCANDADAEDALQQTYLAAYRGLSAFEGRAQLSTWLTRIALHEAVARRRKQARLRAVRGELDCGAPPPLPDDEAARHQAAARIERAIDELPDAYRVVLVLRDVEGLSTGEVAEALELSEENVRVRLHRGRDMLRRSIGGLDLREAFAFAGRRCARMLSAVMALLPRSESL